MNIEKIKDLIHKEIKGDIKISEFNGCVKLEGELDKWSDVIKAGKLAVDKKHSLGVINDIKLKDFIDEIRKPEIIDNLYDNTTPDVLIIGGGVIGSAIARELTRLKLDIMLVDKEYDIAVQTSSRNNGMIHPGIDLHKNSLKCYYNMRGNKMYDQISKELDFEFLRCGQFLILYKWWEKLCAPFFKFYCKSKGIENVEYYNNKKLFKAEPNAPVWSKGAVHLPSAGIVSPYNVAIAYAENAINNGAKFCLNTIVTGMEMEGDKVTVVRTNRGNIKPKIVINAAGVFSDKIAEMADDRTFTIHPRKGTSLIMDKKCKKDIVNTIISKSPLSRMAEKGANTKGGAIVSTIDGNVLVGPNAVEVPTREDFTTDEANINAVFKKHSITARKLSKSNIITYFSGIRASTYEEDFVVRKGIKTKNIIEVAGIQSPGITATPAIAVGVLDMVKEMLPDSIPNENFNPIRKGITNVSKLSKEKRDELIKKNPDYGVIICRCEEISKGEIIDALKRPLVVPTVDSIKRRLRPSMGRCQGSFCTPLVMQIISDKCNIPIEKVTKGNEKAFIVFNDTKGGD